MEALDVEKLSAIKGVGLEIVKKSSGKKKGHPEISKRGRTMYESARVLIAWNTAFQDVFLYYRNRGRNPL